MKFLNKVSVLKEESLYALDINGDINIPSGSHYKINGVNLTYSDIGAAPLSHNHSASNITSGTLSVARGGTGTTTFTAGRILLGNGTSAIDTSSSLFWDKTNDRLGVGTAAPNESIHTPGVVKAESGFHVGGFKMEYSSGTESLQFNFVG